MKAASILFVVAILAAACGSDDTAQATSGIEGQVLVGPQCPVVREGTPCPDLPLQATIVVWDAGRNRRITAFESDERGRFRVPLDPGGYYLDPQPLDPNNPFPAPSRESITVEPNSWTTLIIQYDTGIR